MKEPPHLLAFWRVDSEREWKRVMHVAQQGMESKDLFALEQF